VTSDSQRERFLREARTAAGLQHPNIVPVYSVDTVNDQALICMAYVDGGTLAERVRERGPLAPFEAVGMKAVARWSPISTSRCRPPLLRSQVLAGGCN